MITLLFGLTKQDLSIYSGESDLTHSRVFLPEHVVLFA